MLFEGEITQPEGQQKEETVRDQHKIKEFYLQETGANSTLNNTLRNLAVLC